MKVSVEDDTFYGEEPAPAEFATPRVAVLDHSKLDTMAKRLRLSSYNLAIIGIDTQQGPAYLRQVVAGIKGGNPDIKIAQYSIVSEIRDGMTADAVVQQATHLGYRSYWDTLRGLVPSLKVMGNIHPELLASSEIKGKIEGVVFNMFTNSPTNYAFVRYGITSALLADGYFCVNMADGQPLPWYDGYSAPLGVAVDTPPVAPTANGIWSRRFENGIVLPGPAAASINVGSGYQRLTGELDTVVNNGAVENGFVTLQPKQGLVLVKQS